MRMTRREATLAALAVPFMAAAARGEDKYPKLAPFTSVRWVDDKPEVELDARFYRLRAIDDIPVERLIDFSKKTYDRRWKKRLSEDLVQVMTELGQRPGDKVTLKLEDVTSHSEVVRKDVAMTAENRRRVWLANQKAGI
jgi:integrase